MQRLQYQLPVGSRAIAQDVAAHGATPLTRLEGVSSAQLVGLVDGVADTSSSILARSRQPRSLRGAE
jgi:hypothetical protein